DGFQHYSILFPEAGTGILIMTNSDNGESIFEELLAFTLADTFSPTRWNNYTPYQELAAVPDSLYGYLCPPCEAACDTLTFQQKGHCPHCQMELVPKITML